MTVDAPTSPTWTCATCQVTVRFAPGRSTPAAALPAGWERDGEDDLRCLRCARARVVAIALAEARLAGDGRGDLTIERVALARFELERDASRTNAEISRAIGATAAIVAKVRRKLEAEAADGQGNAGGAL